MNQLRLVHCVFAGVISAAIVGCSGGGSQIPAAGQAGGTPSPAPSSTQYPRPGATYIPSLAPTPSLTSFASPVAPSATATPFSASVRSDPSITKHIAASVTGAEFNEIYDVIAALPEYARNNVVEFSGGEIFASSPELHQSANDFDTSALPALKPIDDFENSAIRTQGGRRSVLSDTKCGFDQCTGIAHVVKTAAARSLNFVSSDVFIPCATTRLDGRHTANGKEISNDVDKTKQVGFIYLGGASGSNFQIDAGVQINAPQGFVGQPSSIQMFFTVNSLGTNGLPIANGVTGGINNHLACDTKMRLSFFAMPYKAPEDATLLVLTVNDGRDDQTLITKVRKSTGWDVPCRNCSVKRVTAVAVKGGAFVQAELGTWLGVSNASSRQPLPTVSWSNALEGTLTGYGINSSIAAKPWSGGITNDDSG